jgi:hypothetical protein
MSYTNYVNAEPLYLHDHDTNNRIILEHRSPDDAKQTLGVILEPNGSASKRLQHTTQLEQEYQGKLASLALYQHHKWVALNSITSH